MTPQNHDDLTNQLGRALQDQADGIGHSPITLGDVKGTATKIRRRRAITASAAVAAAVAIIVPTVAFNSSLFQTADSDNLPPATQNTTPTNVKLGEPLDVSNLKLGDAPKVDWIESGWTLHTADGRSLRLDRQYSGAVRYDDGWLATYNEEGNPIGVVLDSAGQPTGVTFPTAYSIAVSSDGNHLLYLADGDLVMHDNTTGDTETVLADAKPETEAIAVTDGTAYYNVQLADYSKDARWWRDGEETDPRPDGLYFYSDVADDGRALAVDEQTDDGSCSEVSQPDGTGAGRTCKLSLKAFSPDTGLILAGAAYESGYGSTQLTVTERDNVAVESGVVLEYLQTSPTNATFMDSRWEDDSHILVLTATPIPGTADKTWQLVRLGLDGSVEDAVTPIRGEELPQFGPFVFAN